jgi:hypothetical protein
MEGGGLMARRTVRILAAEAAGVVTDCGPADRGRAGVMTEWEPADMGRGGVKEGKGG